MLEWVAAGRGVGPELVRPRTYKVTREERVQVRFTSGNEMVGLLQMESEAPRLVPYFEDEYLRDSALPAYAMCAPCEPSRAGIRRLFQKIETLAGGLSIEEEMGVKDALNARAQREDLDPIYGPEGEALIDKPVVATAKVGRNDPCPCGSGKKYKKCCGA